MSLNAGSLVKSVVSELVKPVVSHKFLVSIFDEKTKVPFPTDIFFSKVSGFGVSFDFDNKDMETDSSELSLRNPKVSYKDLTLERGVAFGASVAAKLSMVKSLEGLLSTQALEKEFSKVGVMLFVLGQHDLPVKCWVFHGAIPIDWSVSDLAAKDSGFLIETLKLKFSYFQEF